MYVELVVAITDAQFKIGVVATGIALAAMISVGRFCGSVSLPPKPLPPATVSNTPSELIAQAAAAPAVYKDYLAKDAAAAGVAVPTLDEMTRKLPYRFNDKRWILELDQPAIEIAGLKLAITRSREGLALEIENATGAEISYNIVSAPQPTTSGCNSAQALPFNAMVLAKGGRAKRIECAWRAGMSLAITRVELVELSPLSAWYLDRVPPPLVGLDPRIARGHRGPDGANCSAITSHALESGLKSGEIVWRDLVDFYARYRCQTYQFPLIYRAVGKES